MITSCDFKKIQDEDVPTTINTLVYYSHLPLTHITVQVLCTNIQSNLIPHNNNYWIYNLWTLLQVFKFGYQASNIVINSSLSSRAFILCVTPLFLQFLMIATLDEENHHIVDWNSLQLATQVAPRPRLRWTTIISSRPLPTGIVMEN